MKSTIGSNLKIETIIYSLIIFFLIPFINIGYCTEADVKRSFEEIGVTYSYNDTTLDIVTNQEKMVNSIPLIQKQGLLASNIPEKDIKEKPLQILVAADLAITSVIMQLLYHNTNIDNLHINLYIVTNNLNGTIEKNLCYSFDFDRKIYNNIDWPTFDRKLLLDISKNPVVTTWCTEKLK